MDSHRDPGWESEATIAASWARIFEQEAEWAVDAATRDAALERAAEARAHAAQLRQAQDKPPAPARVSLTGAERATAQQIARSTGQPVHVMDVQAQPDRTPAGRLAAAEARAQPDICGHPGPRGGVCGLVPDHTEPHRPVRVVRPAADPAPGRDAFRWAPPDASAVAQQEREAARADDERARQRQTEQAQKARAAAAERGGRETAR